MFIGRMTINEQCIFKEIFAGGYALHQAVWDVFADSPDRDFLYRLDAVGRVPLVHAVSARKPQDRKGIWRIESKEYAPQIKRGMRLGFTVRVNPTVKRDGKRHDVVMNEKHKLRAEGQVNESPAQEIVSAACDKWIGTRSEKNGFKVLQFRADGYRQVDFQKKDGVPVRYSVVDITGVLEVADEKAFIKMLFEGLGPGKAFGCGLMLVRRI